MWSNWRADAIYRYCWIHNLTSSRKHRTYYTFYRVLLWPPAMKIQSVLSIVFLGFHVAYMSYTSLSTFAAGQHMFIAGFPHRAEMCALWDRRAGNAFGRCQWPYSLYGWMWPQRLLWKEKTFLRDWLLVLLTLELFRLATIASCFTSDV